MAPIAARIVFIGLPVAAGLLNVQSGHAQAPAARPAFEVASVKLKTGCGNGRAGTVQTAGTLHLECITLLNLIRTAFTYANGSSMNYSRIQILGGPGWIDSDQFDIVAKTDGKVPFEQMAGPMLRDLLEDRFKLKTRIETRELPVYTLNLAKNGLKIQALKEGSCAPLDQPTKACGSMTMNRNGPIMTIGAHGMTIADFSSSLLASRLDRPVIGKTEVTGKFDFHLEFSPTIDSENVAPSIFTAVQQQLGLKLSPDKGPIEVLVIDHVEKPSEN